MKILYIEPYHAGSHKRFGESLMEGIDADWTALTLPGRHWKWRMRGSAAWFALEKSEELKRGHDLVVASSYLPLADLKGLCPALVDTPSILYFHENQLTYPVQEAHAGERDNHFGFTQLVSGLCATRLVFNSAFNKRSFLEGAEELLRRLPDAVPRAWPAMLASKSEVLAVPLELPELVGIESSGAGSSGPLVLWNHRWEYDKNPKSFFEALYRLMERAVPFQVAVCGERFRKAPKVFQEARERLGERVVHWGYAKCRSEYEVLLKRAETMLRDAEQVENFAMGWSQGTKP